MHESFIGGDIGGTKTLLRLVQMTGGLAQVRHEEQYNSRS